MCHNHNPENALYDQSYVTLISILVNQPSHYTHIIQCIREHQKKEHSVYQQQLFMLKNTQTAFTIPQLIISEPEINQGKIPHVPHVIKPA